MRYLRATFLLVLWPLVCGGCPNNGGGGLGGNSNDNAAEEEGSCEDGVFSLLAELTGTGGEAGTIAYREFSNDCREFVVRLTGTAEGTYDVFVREVNVGAIVVDANGDGFLEYDSQSGTFPANFPDLAVGDPGAIGAFLDGTFQESCPTAAEFCTGTTDGGGGGDNGDDDSGDFVTLTVTQRSLTGGSQFMTVHVCIADERYTRANAPYNSTCIEMSGQEDPDIRTRSVPRGSTVTLVADELIGTSTGGGAISGDSPTSIYFIGFEGDRGQVTEEGVMAIQADTDLSVELIWDRMSIVTWGKVNDTHPEFGGGCFDFEITGAVWLRQGSTEVLSQTRTCMSAGVNGEIVLHGHLKPGTVVTLTASEGTLGGLEWVGWVGGPCGAARACRIEVGEQDVSTVAHWRTP